MSMDRQAAAAERRPKRDAPPDGKLGLVPRSGWVSGLLLARASRPTVAPRRRAGDGFPSVDREGGPRPAAGVGRAARDRGNEDRDRGGARVEVHIWNGHHLLELPPP